MICGPTGNITLSRWRSSNARASTTGPTVAPSQDKPGLEERAVLAKGCRLLSSEYPDRATKRL
jgi:hypothetical protein